MSKEELTLEKRRELERRLQDVSGQLNSVKKPAKPKGERRSRPGDSTGSDRRRNCNPNSITYNLLIFALQI